MIDTSWEHTSFIIDYMFIFFWMGMLNYNTANGLSYASMQACSAIFIITAHFRDQLYFFLMGDKIAQVKRK